MIAAYEAFRADGVLPATYEVVYAQAFESTNMTPTTRIDDRYVCIGDWCPRNYEGNLFGNTKPRNLPPGRALHVARRKARLIQTALVEDAPES